MYYSNSNNDLDVAVSTNITLLRNLANYPFPNKMDAIQKDAASEEIIEGLFKESNLTYDNWSITSGSEISDNIKNSLLNNGIISKDFANNKANTKLLLSNDKTVGITLCENNHIQIKSRFIGANLETAHKILTAIDNIICGEFLMAFDNTLGFLTENLSDLGTGLKASITLFLPALETAGNLSEISESVAKIGLSLTKANSGDVALYTLTNCITMGITADEAVRNLESICNQIIDKERYYRMQMFGDTIESEYQSIKIYVMNSNELSYKKALNLLYRLRLCSAMGVGRLSLQKTAEIIDEILFNKEYSGEYLAEYLKSKLA